MKFKVLMLGATRMNKKCYQIGIIAVFIMMTGFLMSCMGMPAVMMKGEKDADYKESRPDKSPSKEGVELEMKMLEPDVGTRGADKTASSGRPSRSGLKAGFADDNEQFNYFLSFLSENRSVEHLNMAVQERILLKVSDRNGKSIPNALVRVSSGSKQLAEGKTYADGTFLFFPMEHGNNISEYRVEVIHDQSVETVTLARNGPRAVDISFDKARPGYLNIPLDILFILDTTGSMGEEIERLKATIDIINMNLRALSSAPRVRFGLVLYKDRMDEEYVTKIVPLTEDLSVFRRDLDRVTASGGGDTPEDLQSALEDAMKKIKWNSRGIRLCFIITDAPPHISTYRKGLSGGPLYTYTDAAGDARIKAIKIFSVGTGGLDLTGEYILRQIAQYTYAKYIFLTYGETGESEGGSMGSVSHHTGANYPTDRLEAIIIRFTKEELSHLTDRPFEEEEEYFQAVRIKDEAREVTLKMLFDRSLSQLVDYSTYKIAAGTPAALLPILPAQDELGLNAEYFSDHLSRSLSTIKVIKEVERKDLQKIIEEQKLALTDLVDESSAPIVGEILGAELLIVGKLYKKGEFFELFLKLLRVETGEVLSVTKANIDSDLGLPDPEL